MLKNIENLRKKATMVFTEWIKKGFLGGFEQ
jgi:hypothetical protein